MPHSNSPSLEHNPPVPTLQSGSTPLHTFLGFIPGKHILSMSARDPYEGKEMPTNGNNHVSVYSLRGVRQVSNASNSSSSSLMKASALACQLEITLTGLSTRRRIFFVRYPIFESSLFPKTPHQEHRTVNCMALKYPSTIRKPGNTQRLCSHGWWDQHTGS